MDRIEVTGIEAYGYHGVFPEERRLGQTLVVDLELELDLSPAGRSDRVEDTVDYGHLVRLTRDLVAGTDHQLLEALAENLASLILEMERVRRVHVRIAKPRAPIPDFPGSVAIRLTRSKEGP